VLHYLLLGGRLLDTAQMYLNHRGVGLGIKDAVARGIPREEIFVTTKIAPRFFAGDAPTTSVQSFLGDGDQGLGLDYIDLVLLHHPQGFDPTWFGLGACATGSPKECRQNAWKQLSELRNAGVIRDIGVSNFNMRQIAELAEVPGAAPVAVNQIQYNAFAPGYQHELFKACQAAGVAVTAWGSFQGTMMQHGTAFAVAALKEIAAGKERSVPQILLRWALQKKAAVIPGTGNPKHMRDNLAAFEFELTAGEMARIDALADDPNVSLPQMGFEQNDS